MGRRLAWDFQLDAEKALGAWRVDRRGCLEAVASLAGMSVVHYKNKWQGAEVHRDVLGRGPEQSGASCLNRLE
jgi:hypothetical protein